MTPLPLRRLPPAPDPGAGRVRAAGALTDGDIAAWADYARHVVPLPGRRPPEPPTAAMEAEPAPRLAVRAGPAPRRVLGMMAPLRIGDQPAGLDSATWHRLCSGRLRPARVLDLHGHTAQRAYHVLLGALRGAHADRLRCIEVITGRGSGEGGGVIRRELAFWLNLPELRPLVLAATHPHPANPGATRLLLRRARESS